MATFCPTCEEEISSPQPDRICTTCGEELVAPPNASRQSQPPRGARQRDTDTVATTAMAMLASSMEGGTALNPSALLPLMDQLRGGPGRGDAGNTEDLAEILPPEALDPQTGSSAPRPASRAALDNLERTVLTPQSSELFDAQIRLSEPRSMHDTSGGGGDREETLTLNAVPGEFGPTASSPRATTLVVCSPRTAKGGTLSPRTLSEIANLRRCRTPFVAYVERGDGVTFVQKAITCQRAGESENATARNAKSESLCTGVIVGNAGGGNEVWPYKMRDSKGEARRLGLKIPVVMIRREDGMRLVRWARRGDGDSEYTPCRMTVRSKEADSRTCPVCTDPYVPGDAIVRLPSCGHVFHERCALAWLTKHNTCPYCRRELPTDDEDYERERRRREALGSDAGGAASSNADFYG